MNTRYWFTAKILAVLFLALISIGQQSWAANSTHFEEILQLYPTLPTEDRTLFKEMFFDFSADNYATRKQKLTLLGSQSDKRIKQELWPEVTKLSATIDASVMMDMFVEHDVSISESFYSKLKIQFGAIAGEDQVTRLLNLYLDPSLSGQQSLIYSLLEVTSGFLPLLKVAYFETTEFKNAKAIFRLITRNNNTAAYTIARQILGAETRFGEDEMLLLISAMTVFSDPNLEANLISDIASDNYWIKLGAIHALANYSSEAVIAVLTQMDESIPLDSRRIRNSDKNLTQQERLKLLTQQSLGYSARKQSLVRQSRAGTSDNTCDPVVEVTNIHFTLAELAQLYRPLIRLSAAGADGKSGWGVNLYEAGVYEYDDYIPMSVPELTNNSDRMPNLINGNISTPLSNVVLSSLGTETGYIDFSPLEDDYTGLWTIPKPEPTVYWYGWDFSAEANHIYPYAIQYWFFYFFNNWVSDHPGDWETITIFFDYEKEPAEIVYSTHYEARRYLWSEIPRTCDGRTPQVFVSNGGHGSYEREGDTKFSNFTDNHYGNKQVIGPVSDKTQHGDYVEYYSLINLTDKDSSDNNHWLNFEGRWGDDDSAPQGIKFRRDASDTEGPVCDWSNCSSYWDVAVNEPRYPDTCNQRANTLIFGAKGNGPWEWANGYFLGTREGACTNRVQTLKSPSGLILTGRPIFKWDIPSAFNNQYDILVHNLDSGKKQTVSLTTPVCANLQCTAEVASTSDFFHKGRYIWAIRIRNDESTSAWSNPATFEVPGFTIQNPQLSDVATSGSSYTITWNSHFALTGNVKLELYEKQPFAILDRSTWSPQYVLTIADSTENDGSYAWSVPAALLPGSYYKIRISAVDESSLREDSARFSIQASNTTPGVTDPTQFITPLNAEDIDPGCYDYNQYAASMGGYHLGKDYCTQNDINAPVLAANTGVVHAVYPGNNHGFGNTIIIQHTVTNLVDKGNLGDDHYVYTLYAHLDSISVEEGECVSVGEQIGTVGQTGSGSNDIVHLHYEIKMLGINGLPNPDDLNIGTHFAYDINHPDDIGYFNPNTFINNPEWETTYTCDGSVALPTPPTIRLDTINEETGQIQIAGTGVDSTARVTLKHGLDGTAVDAIGEVMADGSLSTNVFESLNLSMNSLEQPIEITLFDAENNLIAVIYYPFIDVPPGTWHTKPIMTLWQHGLVNGYEGEWAGHFRPHHPPATRAELVSVMVRELAPQLGPMFLATPPFNDVSGDAWYAAYLEYAKQNGLVNGCDPVNNLFCPDKAIGRAAAVKVLVEALLGDDLDAIQSGEEQPRWEFPDVTEPQAWFYPYVYAAQIANVVHGNKDGYFYPGDSLSRAEMAKIVCLAVARQPSADFTLMDCGDFGDPDAPQVFSVTPLNAVLNQPTEFTVTGMNLPDTAAYWIHDCDNLEDLGGTTEQRQFRCTPISAGVKNGTISSDGKEFSFQVTVADAPICMPVVTKVYPLTAVFEQSTVFTVTGECLPDTTAFFFGECEGMTVLGGDDTQRQFQCTPSYTPGIKDNGVVKDQSGGTELFTFSVNVTDTTTPPPSADPMVSSVTPDTATLNESTVFTITGQNLPDTLEFWIDECEGMSRLSSSATQFKFECTPSYKTGPHNYKVKDASGGTLLKSASIEFVDSAVTPTPPSACSPFSASSVTPKSVPLDEPAVFTVTGSCLPEGIKFWLDECENGGNPPDELSGGTETQRRFSCTPSHKGGMHAGEVNEVSGGSSPHSFSVNYVWGTPNVTDVNPKTAPMNEMTKFTVYGTNLPPDTRLWIDGCDGSTESIGGTSLYRDFQCTPVYSNGPMIGEVKDGPGGNILDTFTVTYY